MTKKKTLKERVRARQEKTGERYTTALAHLRAHATGRAPGEPLDITPLARAAGLACTASVSAAAGQNDAQAERTARAVLDALLGLLGALDGDAGAEKMAEVLRGKTGAKVSANGIAELTEARAFIASVTSGRRGVSADGRSAAFDVEGRTWVATLLWYGARPAFLYLSPFDAAKAGGWSDLLALAGLGGEGAAR